MVSTIPVAPTTLYLAWLDSGTHAAMTDGGQAKIDPTVGAKYMAFTGFVSGKLMVLDLGRRVIMSWRTTDFPKDATDSRVEIHFEALGASTRVTVLHTEIPEGLGETVKQSWQEKYFDPMRRYFSKFLPDPRLPPPPRPPPPPVDNSEEEEEEDDLPVKGPGVAKIEAKASKKASPLPLPEKTWPEQAFASPAPAAKDDKKAPPRSSKPNKPAPMTEKKKNRVPPPSLKKEAAKPVQAKKALAKKKASAPKKASIKSAPNKKAPATLAHKKAAPAKKSPPTKKKKKR